MSDSPPEPEDSSRQPGDGRSNPDGEPMADEAVPDDVPDWDDEYLDRVSDRLMFNYDLDRDVAIRGRTFPMTGEMRIESQKQLLHQSVNYANHAHYEHLFVRRIDRPTVSDLESLVELGHDLADERVDADEEHRGTDFTFVVVADEIPDDVASFVSEFKDRTLLKFGYYGHYEVNLGVVVPDREEAVGSPNADVIAAFRMWETVPEESPGLLGRLVSRLVR